jgi:hypothetical protein
VGSHGWWKGPCVQTNLALGGRNSRILYDGIVAVGGGGRWWCSEAAVLHGGVRVQ